MKLKLWLIVGIGIVATAVLMFLRMSRSQKVDFTQVSSSMNVTQQFPRGKHPALIEIPDSTATNLSMEALSPTAQKALDKVLELTRTARFYKFQPQVVSYREETNRNGHYVVLTTPSHAAEVLDGRVLKMMSLHDNSNADARDLEAPKSWYECTGTFTEEELVKEALDTLERSGDTNTLNAVSSGRREFQAVPLTVPAPDGNKVKVTPFPTVRLYDSTGVLRVKAEYRVGATGVVGLTDWFNNR